MRYAGRTPCGVLGVPEGAPFSDVKRAYLRRARATHPDAPGGHAEAFREVQNAFEILRRRASLEEASARRRRPTPYDGWLSRPPVARQWADDDPLLHTSSAPGAEPPRPVFADVLAAELRRCGARAA